MCLCHLISEDLRHRFSALHIHRGLGLAAEVGTSVQYLSA